MGDKKAVSVPGFHPCPSVSRGPMSSWTSYCSVRAPWRSVFSPGFGFLVSNALDSHVVS